ncbi:imelysin family protein [Pelagibaculum spongiae]|uniref:Peptidase n=1 Tax=Pelagibaculum spongiae TaxID=2080658 RepID=A0A2V1H725_9GAMM|nr:imelysin family protein [Pelagibaculum spongiae]PVZ72242.1 peptidase [Pelagibaculum spongiae]
MKKTLSLAAVLLFSGIAHAAPTEKAVVTHYADLAQVIYQDSLITAQNLKYSIDRLIKDPTQNNLLAARAAWKAARHPYQQTEAYRFGNPVVDAWEGKVNAWPLDEGLIDYVDAGYGDESDENPYYIANVIANPKLKLSGKTINASKITPQLLEKDLHEVDEVEANVATGYHAIEFLLWGQDLNGTGAGAGNRPASDFNTKNCTHGNCDRRIEFLNASVDLLLTDLQWIVKAWEKGGEARKDLMSQSPKAAVARIFTGMGSLSYGELAGERMKLGLMLKDPEEEHDCFSDNTHWSHYDDALSVKIVYTGSYTRIDGSRFSGPSASDLVIASNPKADAEMRKALHKTMSKMQVLVDSAELEGIAYDQLISDNNTSGNMKVTEAINALLSQTKLIEKAVSALKLEPVAFEGSDSLDSPEVIGT